MTGSRGLRVHALHLAAPVRWLDPVSWRRFELESSPKNTLAELRELAIRRRVPKDWATRFSPCDRVRVQEPDAVSTG